MPDDSPTPADESSLNVQLFDAFQRLERGDRLTFGGGIDDHQVVFVDVDVYGNTLSLLVRPWSVGSYPANRRDLDDGLMLSVRYATTDDGSEPQMPERKLLKLRADEDASPFTVGTLTDTTIRDPDDSHHRVCEIEWDASFTPPEPDQPDQEPFSDPDAVIDDRIGYEDHYFECEREPLIGPPAPNQFYLKATNYGAAHIVPFGCRDSIARIDISTTIGEVRDFIKEHMDPELRKAYEQTGKAPKHLLAAEEWTPD
jgi:hypothetical protein